MGQLSGDVLLHGVDHRPPLHYELKAGPLTLLYDGGDLRYIRLGEREILRRVYAAVRDHNWGTVPRQISNQTLQIHADWFTIQYDAIYRQGDIELYADVLISGAPDGTISFEFDAQARASFRTNRTGFCVLHPASLAGQPCVIEHVDGRQSEGFFPDAIAPHQPFFDIRAIIHEVSPTVRARALMEGDTFEMEDQRNWIDASYKTYCTPLARPFPATLEKGARVRQKVTLSLLGGSEEDTLISRERQPDAVAVEIVGGPRAARLLPQVGLCANGIPLTEREIERLRALHLAHLRVEVKLARIDHVDVLGSAAELAAALNVPLEIVVFLDPAQHAPELAALRAQLDALRPRVARWTVFNARAEITTTADTLTAARAALADYAPDAPFAAGTDANFTELNRMRPPSEGVDLVSYSVNPQVHAFEDVDLMENIAPLGPTVRDARAFSGRPVVVAPITLRQRWNPVATGEPGAALDTLPASVDPRQMSLIGATWTLGTLKYLAEAGAHAASYYEPVGWRGVMEGEAGSPAPAQFHSLPAAVFPLYHVLADYGEFAGGEAHVCTSGDPLSVEALALSRDGRARLLLANLTPAPQPVRVIGLDQLAAAGGALTLKWLDVSSAEDAMRDPENWRAAPGETTAFAPAWSGVLPPYAVLRLDLR